MVWHLNTQSNYKYPIICKVSAFYITSYQEYIILVLCILDHTYIGIGHDHLCQFYVDVGCMHVGQILERYSQVMHVSYLALLTNHTA